MPGILDIFMRSTPVGKLILLALLLFSIISWAVIITKAITLAAAKKRAERGLKMFIDARDLREAVQAVGSDDSSPLYHVARYGVAEFNRLKDAGSEQAVVVENVHRSLLQGITEALDALSKSLPLLATVANTGPLLGLFGTVWGIMASLQQIALQKSATIAQVAPGISEALITTALGLIVAVPAIFGYNLFTGKVNAIETDMNNFASAFLNRIQREAGAGAANGANQARGKV